MRLPLPPRSVFIGAPGLRYEERPPPAALAPWVAAVWRVRAERAGTVRVLPDGCVDVIGEHVIGPATGPMMVELEAGSDLAGVRLRPGALPALFRVSPRELRDGRFPLADLPGASSLLAAAREAPLPDPLPQVILSRPERPVRELARETGYSERQLRRRLNDATGLGPKLFARIVRMQRLVSADDVPIGARAAVEHGFYDEAHMINDVRSLTGLTPAELRSVRIFQAAPAAQT